MAENHLISLACDDGFIASIVVNTSENLITNNSLMSDDEFAHELQLQEVIISSLINLRSPIGSRIHPILIGESPEKVAEEESGESSRSMCEICAESKDMDLIFPPKKCAHAFCKDCISRHISIKIAKRKTTYAAAAAAFACPGVDCGGDLDVDLCREILPTDMVRIWDEILCESAIGAEERVYCPYKDCSALLVDDGSAGLITEAECPFCWRLFCSKCKVTWHAGIGCEELAKLGKDERGREDIMLFDLAKEKKWKRCSKCHFFVERNEGCLHMTCRCGYEFCYACGKVWTSTHGSSCRP